MKYILITVLVTLLTLAKANGETAVEDHLLKEFLINESITTNCELNERISIDGAGTKLTTYYNNDMFVVLNANNVVAYSFENGLDEQIIEQHLRFLNSLVFTEQHLKSGLVDSTAKSYGPLLTSLFGQVNCHNEGGQVVDVTNLYTPYNVAVGCVAITLATVLHHNKWPMSGTGSNSYSDAIGQTRGDFYADFESSEYDWNLIVDRYDNRETSNAQREALGAFAYDCAVALETEFENGGSTSNVNRIPLAMTKYFGHFGEYRSNSSVSFFDQIDSMIVTDRVVPLAISGNGYGHSVVCDGWKIDEKGREFYHLNMGWWGSANGWYQIQDDFTVSGYSTIDGGVFNIVPTPILYVDTTASDVVINWELPDSIEFTGLELQVKEGRKSWETLAQLTDESSYHLSNDGGSDYAFRVRMKYAENETVAWSNMGIYEQRRTGFNRNEVSNLVSIFPNPASCSIWFKGDDLSFIEAVRIFNDKGEFVLEYTGSVNNGIDISSLPNGVFIVKIIEINGVSTQLFVKSW